MYNEETRWWLMQCHGSLVLLLSWNLISFAPAMLLVHQSDSFMLPSRCGISFPQYIDFSPSILDLSSTSLLRCIKYQNLVWVSIKMLLTLFLQNSVRSGLWSLKSMQDEILYWKFWELIGNSATNILFVLQTIVSAKAKDSMPRYL